MKILEQRKRVARARYNALVTGLKASDLRGVLESSQSKLERLKGHAPNALVAIWGDIKVMASLVGSYVNGSYRKIPWRSLAAIAAALVYFVAPIDALPDIIPMAGYIDDAFIFTLVFDLVREDLEQYKHWQREQGESEESLSGD